MGRKDKFECRDHYFEQYINSPNAPLPVVPTPRELEQRKRELEREAEGAARERKGAVLEGEPPKVKEEEAGTEAGDGGAEGAPGAAAADQDQDPNAQLLRGLSDDIRARAEGNQVEITGYNVKRDDFEPAAPGSCKPSSPLATLTHVKRWRTRDRVSRLKRAFRHEGVACGSGWRGRHTLR